MLLRGGETSMGIDGVEGLQFPALSVLHYSNVRALPIALARRIVITSANDPYMAMLARLFARLPDAQRAECLAETVRVWDKGREACVVATSAKAPRQSGLAFRLN